MTGYPEIRSWFIPVHAEKYGDSNMKQATDTLSLFHIPPKLP
jgi:hypothetical protein